MMAAIKRMRWAHPFGVRAYRKVPIGPQSEELEERVNSRCFSRIGHGPQSADHLQIFFASQVGKEVGFLGDIAEAFSIRD
jgi:hypothetical protein